jgi:hypothetical protein
MPADTPTPGDRQLIGGNRKNPGGTRGRLKTDFLGAFFSALS